MQILVFKTNLDAQRIMEIKPSLDIHPQIYQWNVDLKDCDNVLRIKTESALAKEIEGILVNSGYYCEELE